MFQTHSSDVCMRNCEAKRLVWRLTTKPSSFRMFTWEPRAPRQKKSLDFWSNLTATTSSWTATSSMAGNWKSQGAGSENTPDSSTACWRWWKTNPQTCITCVETTMIFWIKSFHFKLANCKFLRTWPTKAMGKPTSLPTGMYSIASLRISVGLLT